MGRGGREGDIVGLLFFLICSTSSFAPLLHGLYLVSSESKQGKKKRNRKISLDWHKCNLVLVSSRLVSAKQLFFFNWFFRALLLLGILTSSVSCGQMLSVKQFYKETMSWGTPFFFHKIFLFFFLNLKTQDHPWPGTTGYTKYLLSYNVSLLNHQSEYPATVSFASALSQLWVGNYLLGSPQLLETQVKFFSSSTYLFEAPLGLSEGKTASSRWGWVNSILATLSNKIGSLLPNWVTSMPTFNILNVEEGQRITGHV